MHNFKLVNADTDSISFCKSDQSSFSIEEQECLIDEINKLLPEHIKFSNDGYFTKVIILKAKNYIMKTENGNVKYKGSSLRSPTLESALSEFIHKIVNTMLDDKDNFQEIYLEYVKEISNIKDIKRWSCRKTITDKIYTSERTNETKVKDALEESEYVEGDRIWMYYKSDDTLSLVENFDGDYNKERLYKKLHMTGKRFETLFPEWKEIFPNYSLKRNEGALNEIISKAA
jgi:hypothetical protein